jgi:protein gp37
MAESSIEWTDATWNPVAGCTILSAGCTNCYAMRMAARLEAMGVEKYRGLTRRSGRRRVWNGALRLDEASLEVPLSWRKPRRVFVNSMSDLFHDNVPREFIARVWATMAAADQHTFQILTKRSARMRHLTKDLAVLPNVWLGTSVESAAEAHRLDDLREVRAATKFVSFEPLLSSVAGADLVGIDWAIVGGESGPGARPMSRAWVDEIREACRQAGTAFFFKQWGGVQKSKTGRELDGRTWDEYPAKSGPECAAQSSLQAQ